jgi:hypothetical protein
MMLQCARHLLRGAATTHRLALPFAVRPMPSATGPRAIPATPATAERSGSFRAPFRQVQGLSTAAGGPAAEQEQGPAGPSVVADPEPAPAEDPSPSDSSRPVDASAASPREPSRGKRAAQRAAAGQADEGGPAQRSRPPPQPLFPVQIEPCGGSLNHVLPADVVDFLELPDLHERDIRCAAGGRRAWAAGGTRQAVASASCCWPQALVGKAAAAC